MNHSSNGFGGSVNLDPWIHAKIISAFVP